MNERLFVKANKKVIEKNFISAIQCYIDALKFYSNTDLEKNILNNLAFAQRKYLRQRKNKKLSVAVCGWELSHNAAGRVYTLAQIYQKFTDVEIIGSLFSDYGDKIWEPIRNTNIPTHTFIVRKHQNFIEQALSLVKQHPYDVVHLSKPRLPNIFFGILYKLTWGSKVIMDIDDEELAFVEAETPLSLKFPLPRLEQLDNRFWTRLAVGLVADFDGITVSNPALQQRYGGEIIRHARDENTFFFSNELKNKSRKKYGISGEKKVVLFCGTPRKHKGLVKIAQAISTLYSNDVLFVIVGGFDENNRVLKTQLLMINHVKYVFLPPQPFEKLPEVIAIADFSLFPQDDSSLVSQFQTPAKLSDALAMGIFVLATSTSGLSDLLNTGAGIALKNRQWQLQLKQVLEYPKHQIQEQGRLARSVFLKELSLSVNSKHLKSYVDRCVTSELSEHLIHLVLFFLNKKS